MDFATIPATPATANTAKPPAGQRLSHRTTRLHQVSGGSSPSGAATLIKKLTSDDCTALDCQLGAAQRTVFVLSGAPPGGSQHHFCERFQQASGGSKYSAAERVNTHTAAELRELHAAQVLRELDHLQMLMDAARAHGVDTQFISGIDDKCKEILASLTPDPREVD